MMTILYLFFLLFFLFYALNYIGQKLIAKEHPMNHGLIVTLSAVEGILVFVLVGINEKFPFFKRSYSLLSLYPEFNLIYRLFSARISPYTVIRKSKTIRDVAV